MNPKDIITLAISFLLAVVLIPIAMAIVVSTATTGWNSAVVTIFQILVPVIAIIGIAIHFIPKFGKGD